LKSLLRAILYIRVSTDEQGRSGFSLPQQLQALQEYCKNNGIEVIRVYEDKDSGAYIDRPGLDALREVVSAGGVDLVLTQDRDRLSREPAYRFLLEKEFEEHGTKILALNDSGDDSPEGKLTEGMLDLLAKYELLKTQERTRRGKLQKAQSGKIVGTGSPPYGFRYQDDHYYIDSNRMPYAREIFEKAAAGDSLYSIVQYLTRVGAPTPKCGRWHASTVRQIIQSDTYSGTFYWNKNRVTTKYVPVTKDGVKTYRRRVTTEERPRSEWIGVPVPDSGIDAETIARARESLKGNVKSVSQSGGRVWELSGGVAKCSECGRHMVAYTTRNSRKKPYHYYRCSNREHDACSNRKNRPARDLEMQVEDAIVGTFQEETWEAFVNNACDQKLADLRRLGRGGTEGTKERLAGRISALETQKVRTRDLFIIGDLTRPEYEEKRDQIQDEIETLRRELSKVDDLEEEIWSWEELRKALLGVKNPLEGLSHGPEETAARSRQGFYQRSGIRVRVGEELEISLGVGEPLVSTVKTASVSSSGSTSYLPSSATSQA
jgi:site-specific DNA recombinase